MAHWSVSRTNDPQPGRAILEGVMDGSIEYRRQIAIAQLDNYIDVLSAWRGRYEDDDKRADLGWISDVIGGEAPEGGRLHDKAGVEVMGWKIENGVWHFGSLIKGYRWPMTRREFRELALANGTSLPSRHATLYLKEKYIRGTIVEDSERIELAVGLGFRYGGIDGAHHKQWVIDQMLRALAGNRYDQLVTEHCYGEDGPNTYDWDTGIAP